MKRIVVAALLVRKKQASTMSAGALTSRDGHFQYFVVFYMPNNEWITNDQQISSVF